MTFRRPLFIGVAGGSGSGKTTVVRELVDGVPRGGVSVIHHDSYYRDRSHLDEEEREAVNFDHPAALETELLVKHLRALARGEEVAVPVYDFRTHTRTDETREVRPTRVIVVDGIMVLAEPDLRALMDIRVYVDTDADIRLIRRMTRDVEERGRSVDSVVRQYMDTVRPMHLEFVEPSKRWADIIIPEGGRSRVAVEVLMARVGAILAE